MKTSAIDIRPALRRLFATRDGELVLSYLEDRFYHGQIHDERMAREIGQRDVIRAIRLLLKEEQHVQVKK